MTDTKLIAYLENFVTEKRRALFKRVLNERTRHITVAIEDIFKPHNSSAVVRSCDVFGIQDVHIIENKYKFYASKKIAKGAQKWLDFFVYQQRDTNNTLACIADLRAKGYQIVAATPHNETCLLQNFDINKKSAFFFGVEKAGLSKDVINNADSFVKIPMTGFTESLNISVAAAVILQDITLRLKNSTISWQLSELEKEEKYLEWLEKSIKSVEKIKAHYYATQALKM